MEEGGVIRAPKGEFQRVERWVAVLRRRMEGAPGGMRRDNTPDH